MIGHMADELMNLHNKLYTGTPVNNDDMTILSGIIGILNQNHRN